MSTIPPIISTARVSTGVAGLDTILGGGLPPERLYLVEGVPGSGKTTLALQFLLDGRARGEATLYITLSETSEELHSVAASHGWTLDGIALFEMASAEGVLGPGRQQSVLHSWEVELGNTMALIEAEVDRVRPSRLVFDSLSEMRLLSQDPLRYRRQLLAMKQFFAQRATTVLLVDGTGNAPNGTDGRLRSLCHGVIMLERLTLDFGAARRRLEVIKVRGAQFIAGFHDLSIKTGGLRVFPRLVALEHHRPFVGDAVPSGVAEIDRMLGGGPLRGTSTLVSGPAGSGKSTLVLQYLVTSCERGEAATLYEFDERIGTMLVRAKTMGLDLEPHIESGLLVIRQIDPVEISPGEFAAMVLDEIEARHCRMIGIDSLSGYVSAMPQEKQLILQMHELLSYLNQQGVVTFLVNPQQGLLGNMSSNLDVSFVADAVILLRFFEAEGRLRKAISVLKNRGGSHEDAIRELRIDAQGVRVGEPLLEFRGVMTGTPEYTGVRTPLLENRVE